MGHFYIYIATSDFETGLKYLLKAASKGYELSFGDIGVLLYNHKHDIAGAEKWFKKAEEANCIIAPVAYEYGMFIYFEKDDDDKALKYLYLAAKKKYELAYGDIGFILAVSSIFSIPVRTT